MQIVELYPVNQALAYFAYPDDDVNNQKWREGLSRQDYRNMVVRVYMAAMDARYREFRTSLLNDQRQVGFGLDVAVLGATGVASIAKESVAKKLAAFAALLAGTRGLVDKDLYYDKAVPALVAAMDAERLRASADIERNLQKSASDYPLQVAFGQLMWYEVSASLDTAISRITTEATQDRAEAQQERNAVTTACHADDGAEDIVARIMHYLRQNVQPDAKGAVTEGQLIKLFRIASAMSLSGSWTKGQEVYEAIRTRLSQGNAGACRKTDLEDMLARIQTATGDSIP